MNEGTRTNIIYVGTLKQMGIPESKLPPNSTIFHTIFHRIVFHVFCGNLTIASSEHDKFHNKIPCLQNFSYVSEEIVLWLKKLS